MPSIYERSDRHGKIIRVMFTNAQVHEIESTNARAHAGQLACLRACIATGSDFTIVKDGREIISCPVENFLIISRRKGAEWTKKP